jgi:hypothetical protein
MPQCSDGTSLLATARCEAGGAQVVMSGAFLTTRSIRYFRRAVAHLRAGTLSHAVELTGDEDRFSLTILRTERGSFGAHVQLAPDEAQYHSFHFDLTDGAVAAALAQCDELVARFPDVSGPGSDA